MVSFKEINLQIDSHWNDVLRVRSMFPTMNNNLIGAQKVSTAPFYRNMGLNVEIQFSQPLTLEDIDEINQIGRWINESYAIRLCAFLESHGIIPKEDKGKINKKLEGHEEVDILRRLRNELLHRSGQYNPDNPDSRRLYERMVTHFSLETESSTTAVKYPVHIDGFLQPITNACKRYVQGYFELNE